MTKAIAIIGAGLLSILISSNSYANLTYQQVVKQTIQSTLDWYVSTTYDSKIKQRIIKTCTTTKPIYISNVVYVFATFSIQSCDGSHLGSNYILTLHKGFDGWRVISNDVLSEESSDDITELAVINDTLFVTYLTLGKDDAMCCPSIKTTHRYQITSRGLQFLN